MRQKNHVLIVLGLAWLIFLFPAGLYAQQADEYGDVVEGYAAIEPIAAELPPEDIPFLPRQFRQLWLGMGLDELQENLTNDHLFNFRGPRDVSFIPIRQQSLVETTGSSFIRRAFFQLRDGEVFIMSFTLNPVILDHHSLFTHFVERYGEPSWLNPREAVWENGETRISIERPLTVRYIDMGVFNDILEEASVNESRHVQLRQEFLNEF